MTNRPTASTITDARLDELYTRLDQARNAAALHRQGLITTAELYAAIEAHAPDEEPVCDAYQPPTKPEDSGLCARCGMYDYKHHAAPAETERCCVCGGGPVVYHNHREQPFCWPCADCPCGQDTCVRTGINDPAVSQAAAERGRIASLLAEVLAVFSTTVRAEPEGRIVAYLAQAPVHPDDMARWRAGLAPKEQP